MRIVDAPTRIASQAPGQAPSALWRDPGQVRAAYGQSIEYSLNALVSFVQTFHDDNLVLVVLSDHQPAVMDRISGWGWQAGLLPGPTAPVWPMDAFRDRFLTAYSR